MDCDGRYAYFDMINICVAFIEDSDCGHLKRFVSMFSTSVLSVLVRAVGLISRFTIVSVTAVS